MNNKIIVIFCITTLILLLFNFFIITNAISQGLTKIETTETCCGSRAYFVFNEKAKYTSSAVNNYIYINIENGYIMKKENLDYDEVWGVSNIKLYQKKKGLLIEIEKNKPGQSLVFNQGDNIIVVENKDPDRTKDENKEIDFNKGYSEYIKALKETDDIEYEINKDSSKQSKSIIEKLITDNGDIKVSFLNYQEGSVERINTKLGFATAIEFPEEVRSAALGDKNAYSLETDKNFTVLKPLYEGAKTNLFVPQAGIVYIFELSEGISPRQSYVKIVQNSAITEQIEKNKQTLNSDRIARQVLFKYIYDKEYINNDIQELILKRKKKLNRSKNTEFYLKRIISLYKYKLYEIEVETDKEIILDPRDFEGNNLIGIYIEKQYLLPKGKTMLYLVSFEPLEKIRRNKEILNIGDIGE